MLTFEITTQVRKTKPDKKGYQPEEIKRVEDALRTALIKWDTQEDFPYIPDIVGVSFVAPIDYLKTHYFDIAQLRMFLAELTKDGFKRISVNDLLIYIKTIATTMEDRD